MVEDTNLETQLVPFEGAQGIERIIDFAGPVDLLFVGRATKFRDSLVEYMSTFGIDISNVGEVESDLYPGGGAIEGETRPGSREYGIDNGHSASEHQFSGDDLDPEHALILVNNSIRYGRQFRELCEVLERHMGRNLRTGSDPPTFAFFKNVRNQDGGGIDMQNVFTPVSNSLGFNYVSSSICPFY